MGMVKSERPLERHRGNHPRSVVLAPFVKDKIIADLQLRAHTQIKALTSFQGVEVEPELRFRHKDPITFYACVIPTIQEPGEGKHPICEMHSPDHGRLETIERFVPRILSFEIILI